MGPLLLVLFLVLLALQQAATLPLRGQGIRSPRVPEALVEQKAAGRQQEEEEEASRQQQLQLTQQLTQQLAEPVSKRMQYMQEDFDRLHYERRKRGGILMRRYAPELFVPPLPEPTSREDMAQAAEREQMMKPPSDPFSTDGAAKITTPAFSSSSTTTTTSSNAPVPPGKILSQRELFEDPIPSDDNPFTDPQAAPPAAPDDPPMSMYKQPAMDDVKNTYGDEPDYSKAQAYLAAGEQRGVPLTFHPNLPWSKPDAYYLGHSPYGPVPPAVVLRPLQGPYGTKLALTVQRGDENGMYNDVQQIEE